MIQIGFSALTQKYEMDMPTCSSFTTILSDEESIDLASSWTPIRNGFLCLCVSNPGIVTEGLLEAYNLEDNLCETLKGESGLYTLFKMLESISLAIISIVLDFIFTSRYLSYTS